MVVEERLVNYFRELTDTELKVNTRLIDKGFVDSMGIMELVSFIEQEFGVELDMDDMTMDNFGTISAISNLIACKGGLV
jgi:acyl carrier protein